MIFLCFNIKDREKIAEPILQHLRSFGFSVWYDRKDYIEEEYTEGEYYVNKQAESLFARNGKRNGRNFSGREERRNP